MAQQHHAPQEQEKQGIHHEQRGGNYGMQQQQPAPEQLNYGMSYGQGYDMGYEAYPSMYDLYGQINWKWISKKEYTAEENIDLYTLLRSEPFNWPSSGKTDAHVFTYIRSKFKNELGNSNKELRKGTTISIPTFKAYVRYIKGRAEGKFKPEGFKKFYEENKALLDGAGELQEAVGEETGAVTVDEKTSVESKKKGATGKTTQTSSLAGYTKDDAKATLHVAWTFDDGPINSKKEKNGETSSPTKEMEEAIGTKAATWYVVYENIKKNKDKNLAALKKKQDAGGEIAIHSMFDGMDHYHWFPAEKGSDPKKKDGTSKKGFHGYDSIEKAMDDLKEFKDLLTGAGINTKFIRVPGGMISELMHYAKTLGCTQKEGDLVARAIISEKGYKEIESAKPGFEKQYNQIVDDYKEMKGKLNELGLLTWGGSVDPLKIKNQSWEAEVSGGSLNNNGQKKMEGLIGQASRDGKDRSLVILAHDTNRDNKKAVSAAKLAAERKAEGSKVMVKYHTMSSLFKQVTEENPDTFEVNYK